MKSVFDSKNFFKFTCSRSVLTYVEKPQVKLISSQKHKHWYLIHTKSDKAFQDNVVNRTMPALNGGSFQISLTVSFLPVVMKQLFQVEDPSHQSLPPLYLAYAQIHQHYATLVYFHLSPIVGKIIAGYLFGWNLSVPVLQL